MFRYRWLKRRGYKVVSGMNLPRLWPEEDRCILTMNKGSKNKLVTIVRDEVDWHEFYNKPKQERGDVK